MTSQGHTALYVACQEGFLEIAEYILDISGDSLLHVYGDRSGSCLHVACSRGHVDIVKFLVSRGGSEILFKLAANNC